ncbi:MAG TPA: AI-2E family transporter [Gemmatimonadaceae bacterium]|nr:AI-2E family transporter [Gemmatimonadaceae bacterium]
MPDHSPVPREPRRAAGWTSRDVLRTVALTTGFLLALRLLWVAREVFLTAFLGVLFGLAVGAGADRLTRFRVPRGVGAALIVFSTIGALVLTGIVIAPTLSEQGAELRQRIPEAVDRLESWMDQRPGLAGLFLGGTAGTAVTAQRDTAAQAAARAESVAVAVDTATARRVPTLRERISQQLGGVTRYLFPFLSSTIAVLGGLFLIIVLSIYVGADPALYRFGVMALFPPEARPRAGIVMSRVATVLRKWLVTQMIAMLTIGVVTTIALLALRVKAAVALGVIAGILEFVPTIGPILSAVPGVAMGFLDSPQKALWVGLAYLVIQQLEGHLLIPMLMKEGMDLPPALTIVMQAVMALLFGFIGLMVAVPLLAAIIVPIKLIYMQSMVPELLGANAENEEPPAPALTGSG